MSNIVKFDDVSDKIITIQGKRVILDLHVAELYGVEIKEINQAVKNNPDKFPEGYIIELKNSEFQEVRSKFLIANIENTGEMPKAFTKKGFYMLATILKREKIVKNNVTTKYLDPKNDLTFKRVFGQHKHLCMSLINSMLPLEKPIVKIEYKTGELIPELTDILRNTVVDVRCTDSTGKQFLVEMQLHWDESFKSRVLLNASKAYVSQLEKAQKIRLLKPVYALSFVNDVFEKSKEMEEEYCHHYKVVNIKHTEKQIKGLEFLFVELPKFKPQNRAEKKIHHLWMRFLTEINESTTEIPKELLKNKYICEAIGYMERSAYTKEELDAYQQWKIDVMTATEMIENAQEKGEAIGLEKGEAIGIANTNRKAIENALNAGYSIEIMQTITDLSVDEINNLIQIINQKNK